MKHKPEHKNSGRLPKHIVHAIDEHTVGGFVIFYFNQNNGRPDQSISFDSPVHALALQKHIEDWSETIHQVNLQNSVDDIQNSINQVENPESQEEDDSGDDGEDIV